MAVETQFRETTQRDLKAAPRQKESVVVRLAGDSGDGMQIIGELFADTCAMTGNDICTFPDFPSEIRAPAGSLPGVSGFQIHFGSGNVLTPGDSADCLVVMNPAALKVNINDLGKGSLLIVNSDSFSEEDLKKAGYDNNPLEQEKLQNSYNLIKIDAIRLTKEALADSPLRTYDKIRCKNFFVLGLLYQLFSKDLQITTKWINVKWQNKPDVADANRTALKRGFEYGQEIAINQSGYVVDRVVTADGTYRKIDGNEALAIGLVTASENSWRDLVLGSYPITPATQILEALSKYKNFNIITVQAEDEIAAVGIALGAAYAGNLGVTTTSGPGLALKSETIGLAVMSELPLIVINVMRAGPSTGMPTKTEQSDLLQAYFGRNGESPLVILAASSPSDCFNTAFEAARIAIRFRTPVIVLSDSYLANGSETWKVPEVSQLPDISVEPIRHGERYVPYARHPETLARRLAIPGRTGFEHRIGGLEKNEAGQVSYDPLNHEKMVKVRAKKVENVANYIPEAKVFGEEYGDLLLIGWGSTYGPIRAAVKKAQAEGLSVGHVHLNFLNPLPRGLDAIMANYAKVLLPECNLGQLAMLLRARYLRDIISFCKVQGRNFTVAEIENRIRQVLKES